MALIEANTGGGWFALPTPKPGGYNPTYTHFENSYRDVSGYLHRDIIRKNVAKLECTWNALDGSQIALLQSLYTHNSFRLRFTDYYGNRVEKNVYAGPLSSKTEMINTTNNKPKVLLETSMNFIEY